MEKVLGGTPAQGIGLVPPPSSGFGELSCPNCFDLSKDAGMNPRELAQKIVVSVDPAKLVLVDRVEPAGAGYINFYAKRPEFIGLVLESTRRLGSSYGFVKAEAPVKVIVEHTSANPSGPVHVGNARNSILGDSLARLLSARGYHVSRHFYIDDVGRQVAVIAYGYNLLGRPKPKGKPDQWIGFLYATTSCLTAIRSLKERVELLKQSPGREGECRRAQEELDDWVAAAADLRTRDQTLFDRLAERIKSAPDPEASIASIVQGYEQAEPDSKTLVREIVDLCLVGFRETYKRIGISWDSWDWESEMVWSGRVAEAMSRLRRTGYVRDEKGAVVFDAERAAANLELKGAFGIEKDHEIPPLTLIRSDGTTLYTTRDIAYSFWKFERAERVVNVIGTEQSLAQLQLRVAVAALSSASKAANLVHYAYEMVELPGYKMSRRRGRFVSFDEILDESIRRAYDEVTKRSPQLPEELKRSIASSVGLGAVKYAMLSVAPIKTVSFTWDRVLNFEMNSAPFTQYAHARACNILAKAEGLGDNPDFSLLKEPLEWDLVLKVARFPDVFLDAAESLKPSAIAEYANDLASSFNSFYASLQVLRAETPPLRDARLRLVDAVRLALRNALEMLGIEPLEKM